MTIYIFYILYLICKSCSYFNVTSYLGVKLLKTGNLRFAVKALNEQALMAFNTLLFVCKTVSLDITLKLSLFDKLVSPILVCGSEIWGIYNYKEVDTLLIRFYKMVL